MRGLEEQTLGGLDMVVSQLDRAFRSITDQDTELAEAVVADDVRIDLCYHEVQQGARSLLLMQSPVADDLRLITALLQIVRCVERMGDQCVNIAKLVLLSGHEAPQDTTIVDLLDKMRISAGQEVAEARDALKTRNVKLARDLALQDEDLNRLNRDIFARAVEIGDYREIREWAMLMVLVARCLERVGDNSVVIAEQVVFIVTGDFGGSDANDESSAA